MSSRRDRVVQAIGWTCQSGGTIGDMADAAIAAYEEGTVFECSECGGMGTVVGKYDGDEAAAMQQAEPTEAEIDAAWATITDWPVLRSDMRAALIAARKAGRG